jgi:stage II sporulation protein D
MTGYSNAYEGIKITAGQTLYYNNKLARIYYSSSNGGRTTSSKERWGGDYPYLIS